MNDPAEFPKIKVKIICPDCQGRPAEYDIYTCGECNGKGVVKRWISLEDFEKLPSK